MTRQVARQPGAQAPALLAGDSPGAKTCTCTRSAAERTEFTNNEPKCSTWPFKVDGISLFFYLVSRRFISSKRVKNWSNF